MPESDPDPNLSFRAVSNMAEWLNPFRTGQKPQAQIPKPTRNDKGGDPANIFHDSLWAVPFGWLMVFI